MKDTCWLTYILGYAATYGVYVLYGAYPSPTWGGEALFSFWFVLLSLIPGLITVWLIRYELVKWLSAAIGALLVLIQVPLILTARTICSFIGVRNYLTFFLIYAVLLAFSSFAVSVGVSAIRRKFVK